MHMNYDVNFHNARKRENYTEIRFRIFANQLLRIEIHFEWVLSKLY